MRPRGAGRGIGAAVSRQLRYQRYYNRGSKANWEAMKADEAGAAGLLICRITERFVGFLALVVAGVLVAFIAA